MTMMATTNHYTRVKFPLRRIYMKKYIYLIAILLFALTAFARGGGEKTETRENEIQQISTAPNSNVVVSPQAVNATNGNSATRRDDFDEDDAPLANSNQAVNGKSGSSEKKDSDDARSGNTNQNRLDRDDRNKTRDADDKPSRTNSRRDADDSGKRNDDRDVDDN